MDERTAGRLELAGTRARILLGGADLGSASPTAAESDSEGRGPPSDVDTRLIAARISALSSLSPTDASAIASDIVDHARSALRKVLDRPSVSLADEEMMALESVIHVRGRPAIRVLADQLESLDKHPGSELWQEYIAQYEERIIIAAAATGAVVVSSFASGLPPWTQGSAWLIAPNRVVTNRHVLTSAAGPSLVAVAANGTTLHIRDGYSVAVDFAADDRTPRANVRRRITDVLYVAPPRDPVDIAVLALEPFAGISPLLLAPKSLQQPKNVFVVGHPSPLSNAPANVKAVFDSLDGRKRVSFGKRLKSTAVGRDLVYDASTVGGYSGGPVLDISGGSVSGLHYFGDPVMGNLAAAADVIRAHPSYQHMNLA